MRLFYIASVKADMSTLIFELNALYLSFISYSLTFFFSLYSFLNPSMAFAYSIAINSLYSCKVIPSRVSSPLSLSLDSKSFSFYLYGFSSFFWFINLASVCSSRNSSMAYSFCSYSYSKSTRHFSRIKRIFGSKSFRFYSNFFFARD